MKKKKITLQFDKKVISNLTNIRGGQEIDGGPLHSIAPDAQSECLCGPTAYSDDCPTYNKWCRDRSVRDC